MATKRAIELGRRLTRAEERLIVALRPLDVPALRATWRLALALERAAIAVGEERERGRQAKREEPRR